MSCSVKTKSPPPSGGGWLNAIQKCADPRLEPEGWWQRFLKHHSVTSPPANESECPWADEASWDPVIFNLIIFPNTCLKATGEFWAALSLCLPPCKETLTLLQIPSVRVWLSVPQAHESLLCYIRKVLYWKSMEIKKKKSSGLNTAWGKESLQRVINFVAFTVFSCEDFCISSRSQM